MFLQRFTKHHVTLFFGKRVEGQASMQERELRPVKEEGFIHTIPVQLTVLVGREQAMKTVCARLQHPEVHLVTLTGMGGVGKTRLGLQVATELLTIFADGVCFVSLASLRDSSLVVPTIARALGLVESAEQPLRALKSIFAQQASPP